MTSTNVEFENVPRSAVKQAVGHLIECGLDEEGARSLLADPVLTTWVYDSDRDEQPYEARLEGDEVPAELADCLPAMIYWKRRDD